MAMNPALFFEFFKESYSELKRATWLSRKEVGQSTVVVLLLVALVAAYVSGVDFILSIFLRNILGGR